MMEPNGHTTSHTLSRQAGRNDWNSCGEEVGRGMPLINVKVIEGVFSESQKRDIVEKLTATMVSIEGEGLRGVTWCIVVSPQSR